MAAETEQDPTWPDDPMEFMVIQGDRVVARIKEDCWPCAKVRQVLNYPEADDVAMFSLSRLGEQCEAERVRNIKTTHRKCLDCTLGWVKKHD